MQIAIAHTDVARAKIFVEKVYATRVVLKGKESSETANLKHGAERPAKNVHSLTGQAGDDGNAPWQNALNQMARQ